MNKQIFKRGNTWYLPDWLKINKDEGEFINEKYFWDVILNEELQKELENLVNRYKNKTHFKKWNADEPKGILLYWPPGTGKTTIAKLIASELRLRFYTLSSSEIVSKWIWDSARNLDTFLKKIKPDSILFVDEIDSLIPRRGALWWDIWHENSERLSVVTTFLEYLDWTKTLKDVLFIWATNNIEHLDKAILRPWRFDYKLFIGLPDKESRIKLWKLYLKKVQENTLRIYKRLGWLIHSKLHGPKSNSQCNLIFDVCQNRYKKCCVKHAVHILIFFANCNTRAFVLV